MSLPPSSDRTPLRARRVEIRPIATPTPAPPVRPQPSSAPRRPAPSLARRFERWRRTPKALLTFSFLPLLALGVASEGWRQALPHVLAALLGAGALDIALGRLMKGSWRWPSSALLSGLIVAFVLGPLEPRWITFLVGALATASKYLLRTRQGHVFNPAAFALVVSVPLFATGQSWWGALADLPAVWLVVLLVAGAAILDRLNKLPLALTFTGVLFGLFAVAGMVGPGRVAELFRPPFVNATLFLACFMLTDPPTSPGRRDDQVWVGGLAAIVAAVAQLHGVGQTYLLVGLLAGNLALFARRAANRWRVALTTGALRGMLAPERDAGPRRGQA